MMMMMMSLPVVRGQNAGDIQLQLSNQTEREAADKKFKVHSSAVALTEKHYCWAVESSGTNHGRTDPAGTPGSPAPENAPGKLCIPSNLLFAFLNNRN